jgi:hypothetical protein
LSPEIDVHATFGNGRVVRKCQMRIARTAVFPRALARLHRDALVAAVPVIEHLALPRIGREAEELEGEEPGRHFATARAPMLRASSGFTLLAAQELSRRAAPQPFSRPLRSAHRRSCEVHFLLRFLPAEAPQSHVRDVHPRCTLPAIAIS